MSLTDLGKNDISEETQTLKDRLASRDTENAGLRTQLMRREAELDELQVTLNETVYKLSKEAERALYLEEEASARSSELKTDRICLRNTELALESAQERLKAEERAKRELEATLDTISLDSQAASAQHQSVQREKRALESRVRELERIVQTHEAKGVSNIPRKNGRPRSSSVSTFRLPAVEQELNDTKAQLLSKDTSLRSLEQKLAQAQDNVVKAENARISIEKAGQKRISELLSTLERKEEELESLKETDNTGEREEELLKRIDEDAAKITALEKLVAESQAARTSQARIQKLQNQLKAECEKARRNEDLQNRLFHEKEELARQYEASRCEVDESHRLLMAHECQIKELDAKQALLLAELDSYSRRKGHLLRDESQGPEDATAFSDESALADHIQTLLQAVERLRDERDGLKRALEFSEVEYRITTEGFQARIASLTEQLTTSAPETAVHKSPSSASAGQSPTLQRMKQSTLCAAAFAVVISNLQNRLDLSENRVSAASSDLAYSNSELRDVLAVVDIQKQSLVATAREQDILQKLEAMTEELSESDKERSRLRLQLVDMEGQVATMMEHAEASDAAREETHRCFLAAEQRFANLSKNYHDIESERNSVALQITNLQADLARTQDDVTDAQNRYNTLHAQQLSAMSTSDVMQTLKDRIKELEARIVYCTNQIDDYQHDNRRLEANVKLHEDRIADMMSELELLASQKEAMVEDCAEAREARDEAIEKLEAAEEDAERLQQQLQRGRHVHEAELSTMLANLASDNQQTTARLADFEAENSRFIRELDSVRHDRKHLSELLDVAASCSRSLELELSEQKGEMQQAVISLAIMHRVYKDSTRQLQSLESQLVPPSQELGRKGNLINSPVKEEIDELQRLSDVSLPADCPMSRSHPTAAELSSTSTVSQQQRSNCDADVLRNSLQEKETELVVAKELLEETHFRFAEVEAELLERVTRMSVELQAQAAQTEDNASLQAELEHVGTQLRNSMESYAELEKLHADVIQDFMAMKDVFEHRLAATDEQIRTIETDHELSLASMEAKYSHDTDILTGDLEDREHELDELRHQLQKMSEAHSRVEGELVEELRSYKTRLALANDLENDLRGTVSDLHQRLAEAETPALQEERQLLQAQITGLQADIQRLTSLNRFLESRVRESEDACILLKESLQRSELTLAESEKAGKAAEFNLTLQTTQHEKVVAALRREIVSLQSGPELRSALADLEEKYREMDDLLRAKCQEIEEYDDRILETLKANKKLTSKVESLTRKVQALQAKFSSMKTQPQKPVAVDILPNPPIAAPASMYVGGYTTSSHVLESSGTLPVLRSKTPEPRQQSVVTLPPSRTPGRTSEPSLGEMSAGKKRPAPDDDERDSVPAEGHYSTDACFRNGPTPRLRRTQGHPAGFTPVRGASSRKPVGLPSPGRRVNVDAALSEVITDVTNSPRGSSGRSDAQLKKRSWLGKIRGTGSQPASSRLGAFGGQ